MMKSNIWGGKISRNSSISLLLMVIVILLAGGIGIFLPSFTSKVSHVFDGFVGSVGEFGPTFWGLIIGVLIMAFIIDFLLDEMAATAVISANIVLYCYLHMNFFALLMALALLFAFFLSPS